MTPYAVEKLRRLQEVCRQRGLPVTTQRRTVLEVLLERHDHPTADEIYDTVRDRSPQISRRTVYRVLETLVELELIRRVHHPGASARFDAKTHRHHHLVCVRCNKIVDLDSSDWDNLALPTNKPHGFDVSDFSVQLMGICPDCRKQSKT
ncbi:MAG: transcriptional repressor [Planctomycetaceae bacterium]|nr:transcriptional repressor [Planctomycetaceae bacterium]